MLKKIIFAAGISLCFTLTTFAQAQFEFIEDKHDFGTVIEGVNATWEFKFKNVGKDTIKLQPTDVRASCGCTTPNWTKEPIAPGQMGLVSAQFGSAGRPGIFNKNVTVSYQGNVVKMLAIKGVVIKPDTTKYTEAELKKSSKVSIEKPSYNFGKVERGQKVLTKITVKNIGKDSLSFPSWQSACSCITPKLMMDKKDKTSIEVKNIPPGKSAYLELVYFASADGLNTDIITFTTNDKSNPRVAITLSAEVVNSLQEKSPLMEEKTNAPFGK
jgi:archaellum component FlaG (FlaF/FlaG flagellin family)